MRVFSGSSYSFRIGLVSLAVGERISGSVMRGVRVARFFLDACFYLE